MLPFPGGSGGSDLDIAAIILLLLVVARPQRLTLVIDEVVPRVAIGVGGRLQPNLLHRIVGLLEVNVQVERDLAGAFLISGTDQDREMGSLSGGERARAVLAGLLASAKNMLVLDEPTNHLDIPSAERLEMDSAGRVVLPRMQVDEIKLTNEVTVVGARDRIEVHSRAAWKASQQQRQTNMAALLARIASKRRDE